MDKAIFYTHLISVNIFLVVYLYKTFLLFANKNEKLAKFSKDTKVVEMIISTLFLLTGIYMLTQVEMSTMLIVKIIVVFASIPLAVIGFKKGNKVLAFLSVLMLISAYGLAEMNKKKKPSAEIANSVNGHEIFTASCARCHGEDGKAGLMGATDLSLSAMDLAAKMEIIRNGKSPGMPASGLNDEQIKAVAEYTETLRK
ncbi:MAG TPA: SirB2 family protein [Bacteroidia bacterium]|jgi:mono/diheme cytochrome c family protein